MTAKHTLRLLPGPFAVARLPASASFPSWADGPYLVSVTRTPDELSVVCTELLVPASVKVVERGWRAFKLQGPIPFGTTGVVSGLTAALAERGIGVFVMSTYDTDYILVKAGDVPAASEAWRAAGHDVA